jgi:hypothetical protein
MEIKEMKELLKSNICEVVFTKVHGPERTMRATLKPDVITFMEDTLAVKKEDDTPKRTRKANDNVISCYDIEKSGWRSFWIDSVKSFCVIK